MSDQTARVASLDVSRSILLQAPAGSGKTTVLAQRFLRALASCAEPEQVLAITFTRKAAGEMRERVLRALEGSLPASQADHATWQSLSDAVRAHALRNGWDLDELPQRLRIQTIDSLAHEIARAMPLLGRMQAGLNVVDDASALFEQAARETLRFGETDAAIRDDVDLLLRRLDNNHDQAQRLLAGLLPSRNRWQPLLLGHTPDALAQAVESSLARIIGQALGSLRQLLQGDLADEAAALARASAAHRRDAGHAPQGPWTAWLAPQAALGTDVADLACWQAVASLALREDGEPRAQVTVANGFPATERPLKARWKDWNESLQRVPGAIEALREVRALPPPLLPEAERTALAALARVMMRAAAHLKLVFREQGLVDHAEIAAIARQALSDEEGPTDLSMRHTLRISHLLIDEFQDTSPEQFDLVRSLIGGWDAADPCSLFLVGDPMQSIYLFRDSEVGLFLQTRAEGVGALRPHALQLTRNFRSQQSLVQWANDAFARVFPVRENLRSSAVTFLAADAARAADTRLEAEVVVWPQAADDAASEARAIAAEIRQLRARDPQCSVAVLVQTRAVAAPVLTALRDASLPVVGVDLVTLAERAVVRDLMSLGRALLDAGDRTAWLAVLRSPPCGLRLADLDALCRLGGDTPLVEALSHVREPGALSDDAQARLARIAPVLQQAWRSRGSTDLARAIEATWQALGGEQTWQDAGEAGIARQYLLALRRVQEQEGRVGAERLQQLASQLRDRGASAGEHPVEVLTIHHAKGLEWDVVFVPGLGRAARADQPPLLRWLQLPAGGGATDLLLAVRSIGSPDPADPLSQYIARLQAERQQNERLRLLYVAVTRARLRLYLSGHAPVSGKEPAPRPPSRSLLGLLWPALRERFERELAGATPALPEEPRPQRMLWHRLPAPYAPVPQAPLPAIASLARAQSDTGLRPEFSWVGPLARAAGTVMHAELERLALLGPEAARDLPQREQACAARLGEQGIALPVATTMARDILARLVALLPDPRLQWLLFTAHRESASELKLSGIIDGELRNVVIDRSFIDEAGTRWVIDYKTSAHEGGSLDEFLESELARYAAQLRLYRTLAGRLGAQPVRCALYFPWLGEFRELKLGD